MVVPLGRLKPALLIAGILPASDFALTVATKTHHTPALATEADTRLQDAWHVVVLNDPVNLMSYVVMVFKKVFGYDEVKARKHMMEVHEQGRSVLWTGNREAAEAYVFTLQQWHLTAVLEANEAG